ncbi:glycosyl hydrolase family 61-domain-containing protein [Penicillium concentricum]|uniref:AA9 family lytic polysaccharide monooxygenase n=1 Tax=Penicillium concentricum TaxID=293559 RepID=A0A9W9SQQ8_9EURO|nr:glycosyl hydrolase family 61-domain-containing protein [Penicillium concentricum]KAJ5382912.1 glycosyl hydrolase family 61-domain-containing protein [Penicillium concentricum]
MKSIQFALTLAATIIPSVSAHYFFPTLVVNGNETGYYEYVREDTQNYMPFKGNYGSDDFRCNTGSDAYAQKTDVYKVKAGDTIGFATDFGTQIEHPGPLQVYLSKAPGSVKNYDGSGDWFKIYELGPTSFGSDGIQWGVTGKSQFDFTLPKETPAGQYLVRIEHIALHGAGEFGGAEFYLNCAQIEVESDSTAIPGPTVKIPGVYDGYEKGILFYMYRDYITNYTIPGPRVWSHGGNADVTAQGVKVAPTTTWSALAVTDYPSSSVVYSSALSRAPASMSPSSTALASFTGSIHRHNHGHGNHVSLSDLPLETSIPVQSSSSVGVDETIETTLPSQTAFAVTASGANDFRSQQANVIFMVTETEAVYVPTPTMTRCAPTVTVTVTTTTTTTA